MLGASLILGNDVFARECIEICLRFSSPLPHAHGHDLIAVMLIYFLQITATHRCDFPFDVLAIPWLLDPGITRFSPVGDWAVINTLRSLAMELLLHPVISQVSALLHRVMHCPLLFAKVLFWLSDCQDVENEAFEPFARTLMQAMIYCQRY
jgi:hypothetical protein